MKKMDGSIVIEVVIEVVNEGTVVRSFLSFFESWVVTLVRSLLISFVL